jgi:hypothetical protein
MRFIKWASIALSVFTLALTLVFFAWWAMKDSLMFGSEKFDQIKWIQAEATVQNECKRGDMAYDLQQNILVKGTPKEAVAILLGRPNYDADRHVEYDLGKCMHVYHGLLIYFDENNNLINSRISSH